MNSSNKAHFTWLVDTIRKSDRLATVTSCQPYLKLISAMQFLANNRAEISDDDLRLLRDLSEHARWPPALVDRGTKVAQSTSRCEALLTILLHATMCIPHSGAIDAGSIRKSVDFLQELISHKQTGNNPWPDLPVSGDWLTDWAHWILDPYQVREKWIKACFPVIETLGNIFDSAQFWCRPSLGGHATSQVFPSPESIYILLDPSFLNSILHAAASIDHEAGSRPNLAWTIWLPEGNQNIERSKRFLQGRSGELAIAMAIRDMWVEQMCNSPS